MQPPRRRILAGKAADEPRRLWGEAAERLHHAGREVDRLDPLIRAPDRVAQALAGLRRERRLPRGALSGEDDRDVDVERLVPPGDVDSQVGLGRLSPPEPEGRPRRPPDSCPRDLEDEQLQEARQPVVSRDGPRAVRAGDAVPPGKRAAWYTTI